MELRPTEDRVIPTSDFYHNTRMSETERRRTDDQS